MGLLSNLKRSSAPASERAAAPEADPVRAARARARRRLVGAAVLLSIGVIGFPLLFETQPRPVPVEVPIDIPKKDGAPSLPLPPPRSASANAATPRVASGVIAERPAETRRDAPTPAPAAKPADPAPATKAAEAPKPAETSKSAEAPKAPEAPKPAPAPAKPADDGQRAKALLEGKESKPPTTVVAEAKPAKGVEADKTTAAGGRFVVQIAAYADMAPARDMRQRVEKLGLKSYTQTIEIDGATRIRVRVGPFASRDEAEKAAATLKEAGLPAAVLTL